jgi:signal transduction histidine kinase
VSLRGAHKPAEEYKAALRRIVDQTQQTTRLVEDLLFVARAETGETRLQVRSVGLRELLERICADAGVLARDKGIIVEPNLGREEVVVSADSGRLRQLFMILVDNAIRYSRPHGLVRIVLSPSPSGANIRVIDEGVGIASRDLERIFERFYRGDNASSAYAEGAGLGLPVARAIVEAHGGKIAVESDLRRGTTVSVTLPAKGGLRAIA